MPIPRGMAPWHPTDDEVRKIVAELRPVIDECVRRSQRELDDGADQARSGVRAAAWPLSA
jgi:hypothetical protein